MAERTRDVWITGIGLVSCLGEGPDSHWKRLMEARPSADTSTFAPFVVHPLAPINYDAQIAKKGDQRQMENWQRIGTYAAGLALDSAGVKGKMDVLSRMDMIVAAGGGERDLSVDSNILSGITHAADPAAYLNERLMSDLRPTLFLAQLPNLLAGNISIVHGVTGSSRTFMGEEAAGIDAVRIAYSRIGAGQSDIALVGGSYNGERPDLLMLYEFAGLMLKNKYAPVWERKDGAGGFALGSLGAFLVMEARDHAEGRGAKPLGRLTAVVSDRATRKPGTTTETISRLWESVKDKIDVGHAAILSGATGANPATAEERAFLERAGLAVRATGTYLGHGLEPQFVINIALATVALGHGSLFPPCDTTGLEQPMNGRLTQVLVTGIGHWRGEGLALVERIG